MQHNVFAPIVTKRIPAFAPAGRAALTHACSSQFLDDYRLLELRHGAEHQTDQDAGRVLIGRGQICVQVGSDHPHAVVAELAEDHLG